ncbi:DgyrCDS10951 [Dimorphilus gyrociliatus]|uniref:Tyrosine-protein kinase receptor n=1 Tax=Dimorphilus gyrociliatus TaxID=2664684 RepID=A0A7I8W1U5_9ANNE|nr:DgyrCDS10951 [Dimorphilus gyrociliatus]
MNELVNKLIFLYLLYHSFVVIASDRKISQNRYMYLINYYSLGSELVCKGEQNRIMIEKRGDMAVPLQNCTIILGNLALGPMENVTHWEKMRFPNLRVITGYLSVYRISGLKSLVKLFPKLAVIEGEALMNDQALIICENSDIMDLGLKSLVSIKRGSVAIVENPMLCYIDNINWKYILSEDVETLFSENRVAEACTNFCGMPNCPRNDDRTVSCWNQDYCQSEPKGLCGCEFCTTDGKCCHDQCFGGCYEKDNASACYNCKNANNNGRCVEKCTGELIYRNRFCISETECEEIFSKDSTDSTMPFKDLTGPKKLPVKNGDKCTLDCPTGFQRKSPYSRVCVECPGHICKKPCETETIESYDKLKQFAKKGCTSVKLLDVAIHSNDINNIKATMEEAFSILESIEQLYIMRTQALTSMSIFKSLKKISYVTANAVRIRLAENPNLVDLDFPNNITVGDGSIKIFKNSLLCPSKIEKFFKSVRNKSPSSQTKTEWLSNGKNALCDTVHYKISHVNTTTHTANIYGPSLLNLWKKQTNSAPDNLLGHSVYYQEVKDKSKKLTPYLAASCDESAWSVETTWYSPEPKDNSVLSNLKAYTEYAAYIQSVSIDPQGKTFISNIKYFHTKPSEPSKVVDLQAKALPNNTIHVTWKKPEYENGNVTEYVLVILEQQDNYSKYDNRSFCGREPDNNRKKPDDSFEKRNDSSCEAKKLDKKRQNSVQKQRSLKRSLQLLELTIMDSFYHKKHDANMNNINLKDSDLNRNLFTSSPNRTTSTKDSQTVSPITTNRPETTETIDEEDSFQEDITETLVYDTQIKIHNLKYYTSYTIEVRACHHTSGKRMCSKKATASEITGVKENADNLDEETIKAIPKEGTGDIMITWKPPKKPNGYIYNYNLEIKSEGRPAFFYCVPIPDYLRTNGLRINSSVFVDGNKHSVRIQAQLLFGKGNWSKWVSFYPPFKNNSDKTISIIIGVAVVAILLFLAAVFGYCCYQRNRKPPLDSLLYASINPDYFHVHAKIYVPDEWEVENEKIKIGDPIGEGAFGKVYKGTVRGLKDDQPDVIEPCAVKSLSDSATPRDKIEFLNEASVMKGLHCEHVVRLLGVMSKTGSNPLVLMELMINGDLKSYLRKHRPDEDSQLEPPSLGQIMQWAGEIADGMAYLAGHKFVHRDLAARNCMVSEDKTVKVGDFGMTRDIYETDYYRKGNKGILPVRWMAPESLKDGKFTSQSDVFSFGVVLWEMATLAEQPYQGLSNDDVLQFVKAGNCMQMPENCPIDLYTMMTNCWQFKPRDRPTFTDLIEHLQPNLNEKFKRVSYYSKLRSYTPPAEDGAINEPLSDSSNKQPADYDPIQEDDEVDDSRIPLTSSQSRINGSGDVTNVNILGSKVKDGTNLANGHLSGIS